METGMQGEVEWTHGQEPEEGHTHSKSTRKMTQKYNQQATCNRCRVKRVYNTRANEGVMISGGGQTIAARHHWLDGYGLRFESRPKVGSLTRASKRSEIRASWRNEWDE